MCVFLFVNFNATRWLLSGKLSKKNSAGVKKLASRGGKIKGGCGITTGKIDETASDFLHVHSSIYDCERENCYKNNIF